jgi:hypothetical protein
MIKRRVRVLSGPPRILSNGDISRRLPNSPPLVGICVGGSFSAETLSGLKANLPGLSLGREIPFPRCRSHSKAELSQCTRLRHGKQSGWERTRALIKHTFWHRRNSRPCRLSIRLRARRCGDAARREWASNRHHKTTDGSQLPECPSHGAFSFATLSSRRDAMSEIMSARPYHPLGMLAGLTSL